MKIIGGYTNYGQDIGILMLDTRFPRIIGDIGNANTFHTHVRYRTVRNITKGPITEKNIEKELLFPFLEAAKSYSGHVQNTVEATLAEMESRWYDAGQTMTEADKMVDDFRKGQIEWNKEDISLLAQPELRM